MPALQVPAWSQETQECIYYTIRSVTRPTVAIQPEHILILLFGAIGDVTRALPLLTRVRRGYPRAHITWAVEPAAAPLLEAHPALNEILLYNRSQGPRQFWALSSNDSIQTV